MAFDFDASGNLITASAGGFDFDADGNLLSGAPKDDGGGFLSSAKQAIGATIKGAGQAAADYIPGVGRDNPVARYGREVIEANPTAVNSFGDIADKPLTAVTEATGNAAGSMAGMLGARALGMGITAASPLAGPAAPVVAGVGQIIAWLGPAAIAALPSYGGIRDKQILNDPTMEQDAKSKAVAALGAGTVGLIESRFGPQQWALSAMTKEGRAQLAKKFAETGVIKGIGYGAAKGAAIEGTEELVQNPVEQAAAFDNPLKPENLKETAFGGAMGAIGGGVLGGGTGAAVNLMPKAGPNPVADILDAPDVDAAINAAQTAMAQPLTGQPLDLMQGQDPLLSAMREREASPPTFAPANDAATLLDRQGLGEPLAPMIEDRRIRTEAFDAAQQEAEQRKADEIEAIPELAAEQNTVQAALDRAGSLESPTAMQLALERAKAPPAPAGEPAPAIPAEPRIVERTADMVAMPQKLAEQRAAANPSLEVVRVQNQSGKFAYTIIPKAADGTSAGVVVQPAGAGDAGRIDAGTSVESGGRGTDAAGQLNAVAAPPAVADRADGVAARAGARGTEPVATWFGRRGDGYLTEGDARMAIPSRQRMAPDLTWQVEPMPTGKFRLAGYAGEAVKSGDAATTANPRSDSISAQDVGRGQPHAVPAGVGERGVVLRDAPLPTADVDGAGSEAVVRPASANPGVAQDASTQPQATAISPSRLPEQGSAENSGDNAAGVLRGLPDTQGPSVPADTDPTGLRPQGTADARQATQTPPPSGVRASERPTVDRNGEALDRQGLTAQDRYTATVDSAASELAMQVENDSADEDFDPAEIPVALRNWAEQSQVDAADLRAAFKKKIEGSNFRRKAGVLKAINPTERERIAAMQQAAKERNSAEASAKKERMAAEVARARGKKAEPSESAQRSELANLGKMMQVAGEEFANATPAVHRSEAERIDKAAAAMGELPEIWSRYKALADAHRMAADRKESEAAKAGKTGVGSDSAMAAMQEQRAEKPGGLLNSSMSRGKYESLPDSFSVTKDGEFFYVKHGKDTVAAERVEKDAIDSALERLNRVPGRVPYNPDPPKPKARKLETFDAKKATTVLYRAHNSREDLSSLRPFTSWTTEKEWAEAYQNNPGFGGPNLRKVYADTASVLDVDPHSQKGLERLAKELGYKDPYETAQKWWDINVRYPWEHEADIQTKLGESGYDFIRYEDDFPDGAITIVPLKAFEAITKKPQSNESPAPNSDGALNASEEIGAFTSDPSPEEAQKVQAGIEGKSAIEAAMFIAKTAPSKAYQRIAFRVAAQLRKLEAAGLTFEMKVAHRGEQVQYELAGNLRGITWRGWNSKNTEIWVQGAEMTGIVGTSYETVLHELLHAVTQAAIHIGQQPGNTKLHQNIADLQDVHKAIIEHFNSRIAGKKIGDIENRVERIVAQGHNALRDPGEVISWGLTNKAMQDYLESIPYQGSTLWGKFVTSIRKFLGLEPSADTALSEVLRITDRLLDTPPQLLSVVMPARINQTEGLLNSSRSVVSGLVLPQTWQASDPTKLDNLIYSLQDKHVDTKRVLQAVRDSIGQIADEQDPYLQEELFHGRAAMATKEFLEKSIRPLLVDMQARGVEMSDFEEYLHNRHAERRNVQVAKVNPKMQDGGSGIKTADARAYLAGLPVGKKRAYEALAKRVDAINRETRALLVSSGLEKQATIDAWEAAYGDEYVPLMREEMESGLGIGQGYSVRGSASKRAMGSDKPVANIIANIALQREKTITRANKRRIGEALYGLVLKAPNDDFWFAVDPALQSDPAQIMATQMQLISMGMDPADAQSIANEPKTRYIGPDGKVAERINPAMRSAENVLAVRIDGEDKYVFFNAKDERAIRMVTALKNLDADQLGTVMGTVAKMTRWFAAVNTQYNPIFGVTNITRDVQTALLNLNSTPLKDHKTEVMKHILPALRGIYIDLRDHRAGKQPTSSYAAIFEEFQREGGATGYRDMYANAQERADAIADELAKIHQGKAMALGRGIMGWLSDYNESMENAVRVAAYKVGKEQGMSNQQAASLAKNLTVNFNRKGQVALQAGALYAFFNAAVQGSARMAQTMFEGGKLSSVGKKIIAGGLLLGSMQALLLAAAGFDDDEPPDFVRERALVIPIGGKKYVAIPMPLGFHVIPNLGRIPTEWAMGGFKNTSKRIGQMIGLFADAFNPIGSAGLSLQTLTPTIIDPLAALSENRDWTGKPIAKKDFDSMHPTAGHTRAKDTATPWAKLISWTVNVATGGTDYKPGLASPTPDQIDYLIGQVTGGVGREIGKLSQVVGGTLSGEDVPLHKIPLVGRFVGTTEGQAAEASRFYDNLREIGEHKAEIDGLRKDGKGAQIAAYVRENKQATLVPMAEAVYRDVSKLQKVKRDLIKKDAPRERVKLVEMQITARMKILNDRVRAAEKKN